MLMGTFKYDPELRYTVSGKAMMTFTLIVYIDKRDTEYHCVAWEQLAVDIASDDRFFNNRQAVYSVAGYWNKRSWVNRHTGEKVEVNEYIVQKIWAPNDTSIAYSAGVR